MNGTGYEAREVEQHIAELYPQLLRFARTMVPPDTAEDVVQETCIAALRGRAAFAGRSTVKTWIYAILRNKARAAVNAHVRRRARESDLLEDDDDTLTGRLYPPGHSAAGHWMVPPSARFVPEERAVDAELRMKVFEALQSLPPRQQQVVYLRDIEGASAAEVCDLLDLDAANQRTLLHRGRLRIRARIECYQFGRGCPEGPRPGRSDEVRGNRL